MNLHKKVFRLTGFNKNQKHIFLMILNVKNDAIKFGIKKKILQNIEYRGTHKE